ncbi:MAG: SDR family NAD(P)-dependent oxidoreductase [Chloroflexi bacterium]|nr:SDR family NAD(P)-dependent oxidoreductase [Chloroflexota bacterium]
MTNRFQDKIVVIVGATGGLGSAFAQAFANEGAKLILAGRNKEALDRALSKLGKDKSTQTFLTDMTNPTSLYQLGDHITSTFGKVDVVVNATGVDVRKPFEKHSLEEIERTLNVNLLGAIILTHTFLPVMREQGYGNIVHVGGFSDGRLAFPYYSVDVATRAGIFSFIESVNRELEGSDVVATYFSPSPADTEAERPFHPLWRKMGIRIISREQVAAALLDTVDKQRRVHVMGGLATTFFAKLNAVWPRLADVLILRHYGRMLKQFLTENTKSTGGVECIGSI